MNKLNYGTFDISNSDIAFSSTSGYGEPQSELERRKQLSYPLKEVKTYINNTVNVKANNEVIQFVVSNDNKLQYRTEPNGTLIDIETGSDFPSGGDTGQILMKKSSTDQDVEWGITIRSGTTEPSATLGNNGDIYILYEE